MPSVIVNDGVFQEANVSRTHTGKIYQRLKVLHQYFLIMPPLSVVSDSFYLGVPIDQSR
jgi:hypothetical protein